MISRIDRRHFLCAGGASFAGVWLNGLWAAPNQPNLRMGVISDIHVGKEGDGNHRRLQRVLRYLDARRVDVIVIAGDIGCFSQPSEMRVLADEWERAFPDGKGCDGRPVERLFVTGNHDEMSGIWFPNEEARQKCYETSFSRDPGKWWKEIFGEDYEPVFRRKIKDYDFIGVHYGHEAELEPWMAQNGAALKGAKPFFFVQHLHPKKTCCQEGAACDNGVSTRVLSDYPNCFAISGHSHRPLADERNIWQGNFTSMGASTISALLWPSGCENSYVAIAQRKKFGKLHMPVLNPSGSHHGSYVEVWDNRIRIERIDFQCMRHLGPDWALPVPLEAHPDKPFVFAERGQPPRFAPSDKVKVTRREGKTRDGEVEAQLVVSCPPAKIANPFGRVIYYIATPVDTASGKTFPVRKVLARDYFMPIEHARTVPGEVVFGEGEFKPGSKIVFRLKAMNAAGQCSAGIQSEPVEIVGARQKDL